MSFKDLNLKLKYMTGDVDIVEDFYVPVLSQAVTYDRIAGFFSSSALAVAARGLEDFIRKKGKMRLLCSPVLSKDDIDILIRTASLDGTSINLDLDNLKTEFLKDHVKALGWMLQNGLLEIKLAIPKLRENEADSAHKLFHLKVGVLYDKDGNGLSFSGSINESATAWLENIEEFKVFQGWKHSDIFDEDATSFTDMWEGKNHNVRLFDIPDAVKGNLMRYSQDFDVERISIKKYCSYRSTKKTVKAPIPLFSYQAEAISQWKQNSCKMLFEMATGTGKTRTALAGLEWLFSQNEKIVAIIACPQDTLAKQWKEKEVEPLGIEADFSIIADSTNPNWEREFRSLLLKNASGKAKHCIVFTTHMTLSSDRFISCIKEDGSRSRYLLIGDEAHWLGANTLRKGLLDCYEYRIGLSATPSRWFDDRGTELLKHYFGDCNYEFTIKDALTAFNPLTDKHFLVDYHYDIRTVSLNDGETADYKKYTAQLVRYAAMKENDSALEAKYNRLLEKRANLIKNAKGKYDVLRTLLKEHIEKRELSNMIIFVSPQQKEEVGRILNSFQVIYHELTEAQGTRPESRFNMMSEREHIIEQFKKGVYQVLIAIKCLDEGIDIPVADRGILMASSTNPREYVQRVGRIIRQAPGKTKAFLYDICVNSVCDLDGPERELERQLREKEIIRLREISENAINSADALKVIQSLNNL